VFVNRRTYFPSQEPPDSLGFELSDLFNIPEAPEATVSEPVVGGKKYLCAALENDDITTSYYYLNGQLKRIVLSGAAEEDMTFEIDLLSNTADQSYFSTKWMIKLNFDLLGLASFAF
jgi:hypothetical protein